MASAGGVAGDGGANPLSVFSIVQAENIEALLEMTEACPHLDQGNMEVAEIIEMPLGADLSRRKSAGRRSTANVSGKARQR